MNKVIVCWPAGGIPINSGMKFLLGDKGDVRCFGDAEQAKDLFRQDGVSEEDMQFFTFLHSCGVCCRCGAPLFPSLLEGYAC